MQVFELEAKSGGTKKADGKAAIEFTKWDNVVTRIADSAIEKLQAQAWPGNVRQLENVLKHAVGLAESATITSEDIEITDSEEDMMSMPPPASMAEPYTPSASPVVQGSSPGASPGKLRSFKVSKAAAIDAHDRAYLKELMAETGGNITKAAEVSGLSRVHIRGMLKKCRM